MAVVAAWDLEPLAPYPGPHARWRCLCRRCGNVATPTYASMITRGKKNVCRECDRAHRRATFLADHDEMVEVFLAHGFEPIGPYPGNDAPWPSVHLACGRPCAPYPSNVKSRGGGCESCARETRGRNRQVDPKVAAAIMRAGNLEPLVPYPTSGKPWLCHCLVCGAHVRPTYDNIKAGVGGCRPCGRYGLDWDGPAMVYVLVHPTHWP